MVCTLHFGSLHVHSEILLMNGNGNTILSENICNFQCRQAVPTPSQQSRGSAALFSHWITTDQHSISKKCNTRAPLYCTQASAKEAGNKPILSAALPLRYLPTWVHSPGVLCSSSPDIFKFIRQISGSMHGNTAHMRWCIKHYFVSLCH